MLYIDQNDERSMGKRLQWVLQQAAIDSWCLPNQIKPEDRQQAIIDAMHGGDGKPPITVAIVPYARVNEGINLQSVVDTIIWYEMALNLFMLEQASRRAWRLGKREEVRIYYMAYAGTAGHQKMRKLGGQSGAAASFAGEPARGALIEEAGADQTTLARFTEVVEAEFLTDEDRDPEALMAVDDTQELTEAFQRRANEEQEALRCGRNWLGATDTLAEQLPKFFTGPQPSVWGVPSARSRVQIVRAVDPIPVHPAAASEEAVCSPRVEPARVQPEAVTPQGPVMPPAPSVVAPAPPPQKDVTVQKQVRAKPQEPEKPVEATEALVFGNMAHIQLARQRCRKASSRPAAKKPRVQVEVKDIPAVTSAEEQPQPIVAKKKPLQADQGPTLWDFIAQEAQAEPSSVGAATPVPRLEAEQLTLW